MSPSSIIGSGAGAPTSAIPSARPQPASIEEALPRLAGGLSAGRCCIGGVRARHRAGRHRASDRDHAPHAAAEIPAHRRDAGRARSDRSHAAVNSEGLVEDLRREITAAWETEEVRRERPSPRRGSPVGADRVRADALERAAAVPPHSRSRASSRSTGRRLPLDAAPIRFGSWIGGDRDGNPNVTPDVTDARA